MKTKFKHLYSSSRTFRTLVWITFPIWIIPACIGVWVYAFYDTFDSIFRGR